MPHDLVCWGAGGEKILARVRRVRPHARLQMLHAFCIEGSGRQQLGIHACPSFFGHDGTDRWTNLVSGTADGTNIALTFGLLGRYSVLLEAFPYVDVKEVINAI